MRWFVTGSYRPGEESGEFACKPDLGDVFHQSMHRLGAAIARAGGSLALAWSEHNKNSQLNQQYGEGEERRNHPYWETADWSTVTGFITSVLASPDLIESGARVCLTVQLKQDQSLESVVPYPGGGELLGALSLQQLEKLPWMDLRVQRSAGGVYRQKLSRQLAGEVDVIVLAAGGKAGEIAGEQAALRDKLIPISAFGGISLHFARDLGEVTKLMDKDIVQLGVERAIERIPLEVGRYLRAILATPSASRRARREGVHRELERELRYLQEELTEEHFPFGSGELLASESEVRQVHRDLKQLRVSDAHGKDFELNLAKSQLVPGWPLLDALAEVDHSLRIKLMHLFILHELGHSVQGVSSYNYRGVGRAAAALEQVDYWADTFAVRVLFNLERSDSASGRQALAGRLINSSLTGIEAFDRSEQGGRINRLSERRLRRYLTWHLQEARLGGVGDAQSLETFLKQQVVVELAPLSCTIDEERFERVVEAALPATKLYVAVEGRLVRLELTSANTISAEAIIEAVRTFDHEALSQLMTCVVSDNRVALQSWR